MDRSNHLRWAFTLYLHYFRSNIPWLVAGSACFAAASWFSQCQPDPPIPPITPTSISAVPSSSLTQIANFGTNPNSVVVHVYKPAKVASSPPLVVAIHGMLRSSHALHRFLKFISLFRPSECAATGPVYFGQSRFASLAETHGYIVLYPTAVST